MILSKYSNEWVYSFQSIKNKLKVALGDIQYQIEHVGSTSVPNLDAKPIIDIDIVFNMPGDFEIIKARLEQIGYYHNGNQGIPDRDVFKRAGNSNDEVLDKQKHHLYVCPTFSKALERHLLSRNYLRKNEWARIKYQEMKYDLAERANQDRKVYAALKELHINQFIDAIIEDEKQITK